MPITSRNRAIAFFIVLGACSVALALALNITWLIHWRQIGMVVLGILFFGFIRMIRKKRLTRRILRRLMRLGVDMVSIRLLV